MANLRTSRRRIQKSIPEVSLTPLIDTALTLLVIFMITAPMMHNAIRVDLPKGKASECPTNDEELLVSVDKEGKMFLNGQLAPDFPTLMTMIKKTIGTAHDKTVFVHADETARYGQVLELVDNIKVIGGITYVALATRPT